MGSPTASQATIGIIADQEEEKIQQALAAGTFRIPWTFAAIRHPALSLVAHPVHCFQRPGLEGNILL